MLNFVEKMNTFIESRSLPVTSFSKGPCRTLLRKNGQGLFKVIPPILPARGLFSILWNLYDISRKAIPYSN